MMQEFRYPNSLVILTFILLLLSLPAFAQDATRSPLSGSWQLVKFRNMDGTTVVPNDGSKYTVSFDSNGHVSVGLDCNRGSGTWRSVVPGLVRFGKMALTMAMC